MRIRLMMHKDFNEIRLIDRDAFQSYQMQEGKDTQRPLRTQLNLLNNWKFDPKGCFVAELEDRLSGFIFSHAWGKVGWVGTFAVRPEWQGQGIGKKLLRKAVTYLLDSQCTTIGLETMPASKHNVGFYLSFGFQPDRLSLLMERPTRSHKMPDIYEIMDANPKENFQPDEVLSIIRIISRAVQPGLDYSKLARILVNGQEGKNVLFFDREPWGFALVRTQPCFEGMCSEAAQVEALVLTPGNEAKLPTALQILDGLARKWGFSRLVVPVNTANMQAIQILLREGFRVIHTRLRMLYQSEPVDCTGVNLSSWIM